MTTLYRLDQLRAAAGSGKWLRDSGTTIHDQVSIFESSVWGRRIAGLVESRDIAEYITALHNADLTARIRELEAREAKVRELIADSDRAVDYFAQESGVAVPHTVGTADLLAILDCKGE